MFPGPRVVAMLCWRLPVQFHLTVVPFLTLTVGGLPDLTK